MLIPLGLGLFAKARYEAFADSIVAQTGQISSVGLMVGIAAARQMAEMGDLDSSLFGSRQNSLVRGKAELLAVDGQGCVGVDAVVVAEQNAQ